MPLARTQIEVVEDGSLWRPSFDRTLGDIRQLLVRVELGAGELVMAAPACLTGVAMWTGDRLDLTG